MVRLSRALAGSREGGLDASQIFAIGFGGVVGVAWIILLGDLIASGGPVAAVVALTAGAAVMTLVAMCYGELGGMIPATGGEVVYAFDAFGPGVAYVLGWAVVLSTIAICAFEAVSLGWLFTLLAPTWQGPEVYRILDRPVSAGQLGIAFAFTAAITGMGIAGTGLSGRAQAWLVYVKTVIILAAIALAAACGHATNLGPAFAAGGTTGAVTGIGAALLIAPFWFLGFTTPAPLVAEAARRSSARALAIALAAPIWVSAALYALLIAATTSLVPWRAMARLDLPAARVFERLPHGAALVQVILVVGAMGVVTVWNGSALANSRYLVAMARAGFVPSALATIDRRRGTPKRALLVTAAGTMLGFLAGRAALLPLVNMISLLFCAMYALMCLSVWRLRHVAPDAARPFRLLGGRVTALAGAAGSFTLAAIAFALPWRAGGIPTEWIALALWLACAATFWRINRSRSAKVTTAACRAALNQSI